MSQAAAVSPQMFQFVVSLEEGCAHTMAFPSEYRTPGAFTWQWTLQITSWESISSSAAPRVTAAVRASLCFVP